MVIITQTRILRRSWSSALLKEMVARFLVHAPSRGHRNLVLPNEPSPISGHFGPRLPPIPALYKPFFSPIRVHPRSSAANFFFLSVQ